LSIIVTEKKIITVMEMAGQNVHVRYHVPRLFLCLYYGHIYLFFLPWAPRMDTGPNWYSQCIYPVA